MYNIKEKISRLSIDQARTRWLNFIPIFGGVKMIWEILRWKQFISNKETTYIWHILASTWQLWTYTAWIAHTYLLYKEWWDIDIGFLINLLWSSSLILIAKIWHGLGISKELFDTLKTSIDKSSNSSNDIITIKLDKNTLYKKNTYK